MTTASKDTAETQPNSSRTGVWIVFSVLALGAVMAGGNFLFQYFSTYEALEYWGHDAAALFRSESTMTVALLEPSQSSATSNESGSAARTLTIAGERYVLTEERDASTAGGNLHFRRALLQQRMYDWTASPRVVTAANPESWRYAVTFAADEREVTVVFSSNAFEVARVFGDEISSRGELLQLLPNEDGVSPVKAFLDEQFTAAGSGQAREF